jgi:hypothetical protein
MKAFLLAVILVFCSSTFADVIDYPGSVPGSTLVTAVSPDGQWLGGQFLQPIDGCPSCEPHHLPFIYHDGTYSIGPNPGFIDNRVSVGAINDFGHYVGNELFVSPGVQLGYISAATFEFPADLRQDIFGAFYARGIYTGFGNPADGPIEHTESINNDDQVIGDFSTCPACGGYDGEYLWTPTATYINVESL